MIDISAGTEWRAARQWFASSPVFPAPVIEQMPYGEWFSTTLDGRLLVFFHGGWGKVSAAATAQYALARWSPRALINLGTCGGFAGQIERGEVLLAERTLVYDIIEQMGDPAEAIRHYTVDLDLSWLNQPYPQAVRRCLLVSADRDICPEDIPMLVERYQAVAADWESGAIAWVASQNHVRCLILRGVSDLVGAETGGEAYAGDISVFQDGARRVMFSLLDALPGWLACIR